MKCMQGSTAWRSVTPARELLLIACAMVAGGCGPGEISPPDAVDFSGNFQATADNGSPVSLDIRDDGRTLQIGGEIDGRPFIAVATKQSTSHGAIMNDRGRTKPVQIIPSRDGRTLRLKSDSFGDWVLDMEPGGAASPESGPLSGTYHAEHDDAQLAELTIRQNGELVSGTGQVLSSSVGLVAFRVAGGEWNGHLVYTDGTRVQVRFEPLGKADLEVRGLGGRYRMVKQ